MYCASATRSSPGAPNPCSNTTVRVAPGFSMMRVVRPASSSVWTFTARPSHARRAGRQMSQAAVAPRAFVCNWAIAPIARVVTAMLIAVVDDIELALRLGAVLGRLLLERLEPILAVCGIDKFLGVRRLVEVLVGAARRV